MNIILDIESIEHNWKNNLLNNFHSKWSLDTHIKSTLYGFDFYLWRDKGRRCYNKRANFLFILIIEEKTLLFIIRFDSLCKLKPVHHWHLKVTNNKIILFL
jgi:hypothetical protein